MRIVYHSNVNIFDDFFRSCKNISSKTIKAQRLRVLKWNIFAPKTGGYAMNNLNSAQLAFFLSFCIKMEKKAFILSGRQLLTSPNFFFFFHFTRFLINFHMFLFFPLSIHCSPFSLWSDGPLDLQLFSSAPQSPPTSAVSCSPEAISNLPASFFSWE